MPPEAQQSRLLSQKAYAESRGHDPALLTRWKKRGRVIMVGRLVDADATDARLKETADPRRAGEVRSGARRTSQGGADLDEIRKQRARREKAEADRAEQRAALLSGDLIDRKGVARAIADVGAIVLRHFETFETRAGTEVATQFNLPPRAVIVALEDQVVELRQAIADAICRLGKEYRAPGTNIGDNE